MTPLALTMGDPAGIGPEIAVKALSGRLGTEVDVVVIGDESVLREAARELGRSVRFNSVERPADWASGAVNVLDMNIIRPGDYRVGTIDPRCGHAAFRYIVKAIELALQGEVGAVVTNPINKEALKLAGIGFPGHTEICAHYTGTKDFSMMFKLGPVSVVHVTTHCSLREAIDLVDTPRVVMNIRLLDRALKNLGISRPRIAVGGLNPHAGEHGMFGDEEQLHIAPAVAESRGAGIDVSGPFPPDTVFMRAFRGEFDGVVAMLHDHGFVALKSRDFENGVNITLGLPIIRTSVGHGTAMDIAGRSGASEQSLLAAIEAADLIRRHRSRA